MLVELFVARILILLLNINPVLLVDIKIKMIRIIQSVTCVMVIVKLVGKETITNALIVKVLTTYNLPIVVVLPLV
jgi:hypothetical protein